MAKIHELKIKHFRGFQEFSQTFNGENLTVIIGRGDSGKTSLLKAISLVLSPNWNTPVSDTDFYNMDTTVPIEIEATLREVPEELLVETKYGLYTRLLKPNGEITDDISEETDAEILLTVKMTVDDTLQPRWYVTCGRDGLADKEIGNRDRALFNMFMVADYADKHFAFSKYSPLYALLKHGLDNPEQIDNKLQIAIRDAYAVASERCDFNEFESAINEIAKQSRFLGLQGDNIKVALEYKGNAYTEGNITLHDDVIPYCMHGKGSKRLLSIAIQLALASQGGIILIDELEQGLEPDRIINLIRILKQTHSGQIFVTTHSSHALVEAEYKNLYLARKDQNSLHNFDESFQALLREQPDVFFGRKVICCEGKTEVGILRAFDNSFRVASGFSCRGVITANGKGGTKFYDQAIAFSKLGYDVCVVADNDVQHDKTLDEKKQEVINNGITILTCEEGLCLEQQIFKDTPWEVAIELVDWAIMSNPKKNILNSFGVASIKELAEKDIDEHNRIKEALGNSASKDDWFKDITKAEKLGVIIYNNYDKFATTSKIYQNIEELKHWIDGTTAD